MTDETRYVIVEDATGPTGPAGITGPTGTTGITGPTGITGQSSECVDYAFCVGTGYTGYGYTGRVELCHSEGTQYS